MEKEIRAINRIAEIELVYRPKLKASERPKVVTAAQAYHIFLKGWNENDLQIHESFKVMLLNRGGKVLGIYPHTRGGISACCVDPRLIFAAAIKAAATAIILCHNHPSGRLVPSKQDERITRKIKEGGQLLDIALLDHLIISSEGFCSCAEEGLL